jgi:hypothetical protein
MPHSLRAKWRSEWQTPQWVMAISTSSGRRSRREMEKGARGVVADWVA